MKKYPHTHTHTYTYKHIVNERRWQKQVGNINKTDKQVNKTSRSSRHLYMSIGAYRCLTSAHTHKHTYESYYLYICVHGCMCARRLSVSCIVDILLALTLPLSLLTVTTIGGQWTRRNRMHVEEQYKAKTMINSNKSKL